MAKLFWLMITVYIYADACASTPPPNAPVVTTQTPQAVFKRSTRYSPGINAKLPQIPQGIAACSSINLNPIDVNCAVDMTIGLDFSTAMLASTNIQALGNFVVNQFVPAFPISLFNTKIAVEVFGTYSVTNSVYFDNYEDICNYIHAQMENSDQLGMTDVLLADVLRKYYDDLLSEGRAGYPQNLVLFTAISQPSIINNALEIANQIKAAGVSINVIGINQPANSPLVQIATNYYSVPNFNPYNIVINWASNNICAGNSSVNSTEDIPLDGTTPSQEETASTMIFAPIMYPFGNLHSGKNTTGNNSTSGSQSLINVTTEISATTMKLDMTSGDGASTHLGDINQSTTSGQVSQTTSEPEGKNGNAGNSGQNETDSSTIATTTVDLPITSNGDVVSGDNETNSSNGKVDSTTLVSATTNSSNIESETNTSTTVENFPSENSGNNSNQVGQNGTNLSSGIKSINQLVKVLITVDPPKTTEESETSTDDSTTSMPKSDSSKKGGPSQKNKNGSGASHNSKGSGYSATTLDPPASTTKDPPKSPPKAASKNSTKTQIAPLKGASKPAGTTSDPGTTQIPIVPETNREGTPCIMNSQNAWIDIVIVVEVSNAMTETALNGLGASIADLVLFFNLNQSQIHSSRFALVTFNSNAVVQFDYTKYTDQQSLIKAFMGLSGFMTTDPIANMASALNVTNNLIYNEKSHRRPVVILAASTYMPEYGDPLPLGKLMSSSDIFISTLNYAPDNMVATDGLRRLANPYMSFTDEGNVQSKLAYALVSANCMCELGKQQVQYYTIDSAHKNITYYADCYMGYKSGVAPGLAEGSCQNINGNLVMEVSNDQSNFIQEQVVQSKDLVNALQEGYTIGLHRINNTSWTWYGPGNELVELSNGDYTKWCDSSYMSSTSGTCVYAKYNNGAFCWMPSTRCEDGSFALPYICQFRSCDTDHFMPGCAWNKEA